MTAKTNRTGWVKEDRGLSGPEDRVLIGGIARGLQAGEAGAPVRIEIKDLIGRDLVGFITRAQTDSGEAPRGGKSHQLASFPPSGERFRSAVVAFMGVWPPRGGGIE